jgi:ElaB/YqjD/DUF883 family membrane-anchored ribosome-binding protein
VDQEERLRIELEHTRASLVDQLERLEDRLMAFRERAANLVDLRSHLHRQPWTSFGAAFLLGFLLGGTGSYAPLTSTTT